MCAAFGSHQVHQRGVGPSLWRLEEFGAVGTIDVVIVI